MAAKPTKKPRPSKAVPSRNSEEPDRRTPADALPTGPTGRTVITLRPGTQASHIRALRETAGMSVASTADFEGAVITVSECGADALLYEHLDVVVVCGDADQVRALEASVQDADNPVLNVEPEMFAQVFSEESPAYALPAGGGREYLRGYVDGISMATRLLLEGGHTAAPQVFEDTDRFTWGLQATRVDALSLKGRGVRVAVLDTGLDLRHPDFVGRSILSASFVPGVTTAQDGHGHGTHCIGTACGSQVPAGRVRRYGVASGATILAGKVLTDAGSGQQGWILAGINWAIQNRATVISLSLGSTVTVGQSFSPAYEQAAQAALNRRCLIVAAAGNDGLKPVGSPANCPSVMAVAAVDPNLQRSSFSCIGLNPDGGEVNIAAPGRNVFSSVPIPERHRSLSGTSMATPHVAGIAALWARRSGAHAMALWEKLTSTALDLEQPAQMVGVGLVQAPEGRAARKRPPLLARGLDPLVPPLRTVALEPPTQLPPVPNPPIHIPPIHGPGPLK